MLPSQTILGYINQSNGVQHLQYLSFLKQIFITAAAGITAHGAGGGAYGAIILGQTNQLSNEEFGYQGSLDPIWNNFALALALDGQAAKALVISNYLLKTGRQQIVWTVDIQPLVLAIQEALAALGQ